MTLELTLGLVLVGLLIGLGFKLSQGRGHSVIGHEKIDLNKLQGRRDYGVVQNFGSKATTVLFTTSFCSICPAVSRQLIGLEKLDSGLQHIEVDITERLDLAAHFGISQTPTVLIADKDGQIRFRVSGAPKPGVLAKELNELGVITK